MAKTPPARLTARNVLTLPIGEHRDLALPLFLLRVRSCGGHTVRTYGLRYSVGGGRMQRARVGNALTLSLEDARAEARRLLARLYTGDSSREVQAQTSRDRARSSRLGRPASPL